MRKVMLYCGLGMSTSMLVTKAQKELNARGITDLEFLAVGNVDFENKIGEEGVVLCLMGPQVRYLTKKVKACGFKYNVLVDMINPNDYCNINAKNVLNQVLTLI